MKTDHPLQNRNLNKPVSGIQALRKRGLIISLTLLLLSSLACGIATDLPERDLSTPGVDPSPTQETSPAVMAVTSSPEKETPSATNTTTPPPTSTPLPSGGPARRRFCPAFLPEEESTNTSLKIVEKEFKRFEYSGDMGELFALDNGIGMIRTHPFFGWLEVVATSEDGMNWEYIPEKSRPHPAERGLKDVPPCLNIQQVSNAPDWGEQWN